VLKWGCAARRVPLDERIELPLHTSITRDGELLQLAWGDFHVAVMAIASSVDAERGLYEDPVDAARNARDLMNRNGCIGIDHGTVFAICMYHVLGSTPVGESGFYKLTKDWTFYDNSDGERFVLKAGDELRMSRN
jgi:hypothetical protein